jgi:iron complex outermembrane receptor protein
VPVTEDALFPIGEPELSNAPGPSNEASRYLGGFADLHWRGWDGHLVLLGVEASRVQVDQASWTWFNLPFEVPETWLDTALDRRILSAILQDELRASDRVTVTAALSLDDYSDLGAFLTPRLAAVWRIDDSNILKLQYARAFRPPTFYEQAYPGRDSIGAGEIATYELGYILKQPRWEGRLILFQSDLTDPIVFGEDDGVYPDGYPRPGRRWWLSVGYAF